MMIMAGAPTRFPEDRPLKADLGHWWVVHVKPNCEKMMATYLFNRGISYFLPMYRKKQRQGHFKRFKIIEEPLFRGYLCFALEKEDHNLLYDTKKLVRIIQVKDQEKFVQELEAVARVAEKLDDLVVKPGLAPGKKIMILSGPLEGTIGVILRRRETKQLALSVEMFNQTVLVRLDPDTEVEVLS
ncbi:MAG: transcription termination/antitermination NusG family protein [Thermodesulfobacteriota bacterium]